MEKQIYHDLGTPKFRDPKTSKFWEIGEFHPAVSDIDGIEYLGRTTPIDYRNGTAKYKLRNVEITHFQEIEPEYEIIEVKLKGEDEAALGEVEKIVKIAIVRRELEAGALAFPYDPYFRRDEMVPKKGIKA